MWLKQTTFLGSQLLHSERELLSQVHKQLYYTFLQQQRLIINSTISKSLFELRLDLQLLLNGIFKLFQLQLDPYRDPLQSMITSKHPLLIKVRPTGKKTPVLAMFTNLSFAL